MLCIERPLLKFLPTWRIAKLLRGIIVFLSVALVWVFFRATTFDQAIGVCGRIAGCFSSPGQATGVFSIIKGAMLVLLVIGGDAVVSFLERRGWFVKNVGIKGVFVGFCVATLLLLGSFQGNSFIYQQF